MNKTRKYLNEFIFIALSYIAVYVVIWSFTGEWPWRSNPYNSYILQAKAWLSGQLDLGRNYEHLELAVFNGKYFVSFPPLPSVFLLPFSVFNLPDNFASVAVGLGSCFFALHLTKKFPIKNRAFLVMFFMLASDILIVGVNSWVWFIAQSMSLCLTLAAFYFAEKKSGTAALALLSCAVLCRPFQIVYFPMIILILSDNKIHFRSLRKQLVIPILLSAACMLYNFARFKNPFEFGHNYLPEFINAPKGQFDLSYISENAKSLVLLPSVASDGKLVFPQFNGMSIFLCFPITVFCILYSAPKITKPKIFVGYACIALHLLLLLSHKTMGGYHFGNRYIIDIMPCLFYMLLYSFPKNENTHIKIMTPFFIFGLCLNLAGAINMFA